MKFLQIFKTSNPQKDKFLARSFGIFSEEIVKIWCRDKRSPYEELGRPTLKKGSGKQCTLDFTFKSRRTDRIYICEMKCWLEYQNYHCLILDSMKTLWEAWNFAFECFLDFSKRKNRYVVKINREPVRAAGSILIWATVSKQGRKAVMKETGLYDVLSLEDIVTDLISWQNEEYQNFLNQRLEWFKALTNDLSPKN